MDLDAGPADNECPEEKLQENSAPLIIVRS
jgi:hypothetical protein